MHATPIRQALPIFALLALMMAATRYHHFGSALHLPDASLAVFALAGFYLRRWVYLPVFLLGAGLIDYLAISVGGASDFCITPAYVFLVPTYAVMWFAGLWYARHHRMAWGSLVSLFGTVLGATVLAFLISNASFFLLSDRITDTSLSAYVDGVTTYLPRYLGSVLAYTAFAALVHVIVVNIARHHAAHHDTAQR